MAIPVAASTSFFRLKNRAVARNGDIKRFDFRERLAQNCELSCAGFRCSCGRRQKEQTRNECERVPPLNPFPRLCRGPFASSSRFHFVDSFSVGENRGAEHANQEPDQWAEDCEPERNPPSQFYFALFHDNDLLGRFVLWAVFLAVPFLPVGRSPVLSAYPPKR